ncbi:hypothetical protein DX130_11765 [Paenibacillus paeoniae]|uniref:VCBS repeat-containing protein n=2 Tax=Paenibacillus paeoniae TaxID=2292705 RepID=A0A371PN67_9BACL|nr:hypothetical protein DX130_11765 [Paenibacillus paeoniae]
MTSTVTCSDETKDGAGMEGKEYASLTALPQAAEHTQDESNSELLSDEAMLAELPEHAISITGGDSGVILRIGEREQAYDWPYMTPRGIKPSMTLGDLDGDGADELAIILYIGSGTGVSVSDLRIVHNDTDGFRDYYFEPENYIGQVKNVAKFSSLRQKEELFGKLTLGDDSYTVSLKEYDSEESGQVEERLVIGDIANFWFDEDRIIASFGAGISFEKFVIPVYIGNIEAEVKYESGAFRLTDFRFIPPGE